MSYLDGDVPPGVSQKIDAVHVCMRLHGMCMANSCGSGYEIVSFSGLPTVQFCDRLQYAKMEGEGLVHFIT